MTGSAAPVDPRAAERSRFERLRGEVRLRAVIDDLADQLCQSVDGNFDFSVRGAVEDETLEKLSMLINFVLDTARRGMTALRDHNAALAQLDQAKTVFFSNASHELRTPLTLILGPMENALASPTRALAGEELEVGYRNAQRLHKLVNALLDFSRLEGGRLLGSFAATDLAALTQDLAAIFRAPIEGAGLRYTVNCEPLPEPVFVDRDMWESIVLNLISNAFKATFTGGIEVSLLARGDMAELAVRDTGTGIPAAEIPRMFERFHRVQTTRSRTHEGFGIGLAMTAELVRLHGGKISVESEPDKGTVFTVLIPRGNTHLPAERIQAAAPTAVSAARADVLRYALPSRAVQPQSSTAPQSIPKGGRRGRILVADDNDDMRAYVARLLATQWIVEAVPDGNAALEAALRQPPDLVLADVMMPGLDGHALLRQLRSESATRHIPVILLSARAGAEAVAESLELGADDYLVKPFAARELQARVRTHLELSRLRSDNAIIQRVGALLNNAQLDLKTVVQTLTGEAMRLCEAEFGAFFYNQFTETGEQYMLYTLAGAPQDAFANFPLPRVTALFEPTFSGKGTVRVADVRADPRYGQSAPYYGMPPGHLPVRSYLAVPVVSRNGRVLGGLFFGHKQPGMFSEHSERLLEAVAAQAAAAIDNAHLFEREQAARAEAEAANRAKDEFLAMLGHELRNPLAPMLTALDVMALRGDSTTAAERGIIRRQVTHMVRLVQDLLDVSRITRGRLQLSLETLDMANVVTRATEIVSPILEDRRHKLEVSVQKKLKVRGDSVRLAQVIANLLHNAAKFTAPSGRIELSASSEDGQAVLRVRDNGIGMGPEAVGRVFDLFVQGAQSLDRASGGLGLGLAIARSLVQQHGGTIEARSAGTGRGSEFTVRLPLAEGTEDTKANATSEPPAPRSDRVVRVLVVDDNVDAARMLGEAVRLMGHESVIANDGPEALRIAQSSQMDVVLLDLGLPAMDGYEVAQRLRALPNGKALRLVAITGYGQPSDKQRSAAAGFDRHLVKPVDIAAIDALIREWGAAG